MNNQPSTKTKLAFFGSPAFALPVLEALHAHFEIVLVVAQPSKPAGRGLKLTPPAVAGRANELGLPLEQPTKLRNNPSIHDRLRESAAGIAVTCAYGKILPASLLDLPEHGFFNVHTSLLPKYRGAAPIQWAIIEGETRTGVTIMQTDPGLDTGPVLLQESLEIGAFETTLELAPRLAALGANLIVQAVQQANTLPRVAQDDTQATVARLLEKDDGRIDWTQSAKRIHDRYRGLVGWPGSFFELAQNNQAKRIKVLELRPGPKHEALPGTVLELGEAVTIACALGSVQLLQVQPEGKPRMKASDWARGHQIKPGHRL